jgi:hypothetical protein
MSNPEEITTKTRWFALTKENGKGVQHQVVMIEKDEEEGDTLTEPVIYTWSDPTENGGHTWVGPESQFRKLFKFIGFGKKKS